jgi:hypothetical protein
MALPMTTRRPYLPGKAGVQARRQRDVRERADGHQGQLAGGLICQADEGVRRMFRRRLTGRRGIAAIAQPVQTVRDRPARGRDHQSVIAARIHRRIPPDHIEDDQGIAGHGFQRNVARHGGDGFYGRARIGERQHDRVRVINAGIGVNHDAVHALRLPAAAR